MTNKGEEETVPAYFNISLQFRRKNLHPCFVRDFYSVLFDAGMKFRSGYWGSEGDSLDKIVAWNQEKLNQNFVLGYEQNYKHDYKQMLFDFADFSEARGFWMNEGAEEGVFSYEVIVPEGEVFARGERIISESGIKESFVWLFERDKINMLFELSKKIWQFPHVKAIQTGLELDDGAIGLGDLEKGGLPSIRPFAILEKNRNRLAEERYSISRVSGRDGICIHTRGWKCECE